MKKEYFFTLAILAAAASISSESTDYFFQIIQDCHGEFKITDANEPNDPRTRCVQACIMKKIGNLADGKVVLENELELAKLILPDVDDKLKTKIITECAERANKEKDECDVANSVTKCINESELFPLQINHTSSQSKNNA